MRIVVCHVDKELVSKLTMHLNESTWAGYGKFIMKETFNNPERWLVSLFTHDGVITQEETYGIRCAAGGMIKVLKDGI